jgi:hypothetical protein
LEYEIMALGKGDLRVTNADGESVVFVTSADTSQSIKHETSGVNVPLNISVSNYDSAGGQYDVRDTEGDKGLSALDWRNGQGQDSLDSDKASWSMFKASSYINIGVSGRISLLRDSLDSTILNMSGPVFSALGNVWYGTADGGLYYSSDGITWSEAEWGSEAPSISISCMATDGKRLYVGMAGGLYAGLWANFVGAGGDIRHFERFPADATGTHTHSGIQELAYNGGFLYAATDADAGIIDSGTGAYHGYTPTFLNQENITKALVSCTNSVYWVVENRGSSYVYELKYDIDAGTMTTEQAAVLPQGFIATCAVGYLGNLDVGGYFETRIPGVGMGSVYRIADGYMALLFKIGEPPEDTDSPVSSENDNRIIAACSGSKDEYFLTQRACYRWDLDDSGYSHVFDFAGAGMPVKITNQYAADVLPVGGTVRTEGAYTIHTFETTGTFTISEHWDKDGNLISTLPVEIMVQGAGAEGGDVGGGGGGGGENTSWSGTLGATNPIVTINVGTGGVANGAAATLSEVKETNTVKATAAAGGRGGDFGANGATGAAGGGAGGGYGKTGGAATAASPAGDGGANNYSVNDAGTNSPASGGGGAGEVGGAATEAVAT